MSDMSKFELQNGIDSLYYRYPGAIIKKPENSKYNDSEINKWLHNTLIEFRVLEPFLNVTIFGSNPI
tara:strand:- start:491 stop:691 length:201 start_codon:yes stop_codon:yes gene_type:complete